MHHRALLASMIACSIVGCSNPVADDADDRTVQQFAGIVEIDARNESTGQFDRGARVVLPGGGTVDAAAVITPTTDLNFRFGIRLDAAGPIQSGDPAPPPNLTARWNLAPGTYRAFVYPVLEGRPAPSSPQTFNVTGRLTFP